MASATSPVGATDRKESLMDSPVHQMFSMRRFDARTDTLVDFANPEVRADSVNAAWDQIQREYPVADGWRVAFTRDLTPQIPLVVLS